MKERFYTITLFLATVVLVIVCANKLGTPKYSYSEELAGTIMECNYTKLNARITPGNGEVTKNYGYEDRIKLSGKVAELFLWDDDNTIWYETEDGYWITSDAVHPLELKLFGR